MPKIHASKNGDGYELRLPPHEKLRKKPTLAQEAAELNRRLTDLDARLKDRPEVTIEYFVPDERKSGGAYVSVTGVVRHISVPEKTLVMEDGKIIPLDDIASIVF